MNQTQPSTRTITPEQMSRYIARFAQLKPQSAYYEQDTGIPGEAYETVTAKTLFTVMAPSANAGPMSAQPAIVSGENLSVIIAKCPPGDKPMLHAHFQTTEHFLCLDGRFRIRWGDKGEHETYLEPYDMIAVPRGVCRDFTNVTHQDAHLLVMITGARDKDYNDIGFAPSESAEFRRKFGDDVTEKLESIGFTFLD